MPNHQYTGLQPAPSGTRHLWEGVSQSSTTTGLAVGTLRSQILSSAPYPPGLSGLIDDTGDSSWVLTTLSARLRAQGEVRPSPTRSRPARCENSAGKPQAATKIHRIEPRKKGQCFEMNRDYRPWPDTASAVWGLRLGFLSKFISVSCSQSLPLSLLLVAVPPPSQCF